MAGDIRTRIVIDADAAGAVKALDAVDAAADRADRSIDDITDRVDVDTRRAVGNLDDVESAADDADRAIRAVDDSVTVSANTSDLADAAGDVDRLRDLARDPVRVSVDVDTMSLDRVKRAGDDVKQIGVNAEGLQRGVGPLRGFTDELGGAAGAAGTATNALIDAGEAVEIFGAQLGLSQQTLGRVSLALGGIGLAVGAATIAWSKYRDAQKKAQERAELLVKVQDQLADRKYREAAETLADAYADTFADAIAEGLTYDDVIGLLTDDTRKLSLAVDDQGRILSGTAETASGKFVELSGVVAGSLTGLRDGFTDAGAELKTTTDLVTGLEGAFRTAGTTGEQSGTDAARGVDKITAAADGAATGVDDITRSFEDMKTEMADQRAILDVQDAFDQVNEAAAIAWESAVTGSDDAESSARDYQRSILDAKADVFALVEEIGNVPPETTAKILADLDQGSVEAARATLDELTKQREITAIINTLFQVPQTPPMLRPPSTGTLSAPAPVVNQTILVRATPAMRDVDAAATRWRRIEQGR